MQEDFDAFRLFDYAHGNMHLWVFKDSATPRKFSAFYVQTDDVLNNLIRGLVHSEVARLTEFAPYTYLSEVNENSCLVESAVNGDFPLLKVQVDRPEPECAVRSIKDLKGAEGYVVKFVHNGQIVYAVKRSTTTWKTSYPKKYINMIFQNGELSAAEDEHFSIERNFDFYVINDSLFIANKRAFESTMHYKDGYINAFAELRVSPAFSSLFTDMQPLIDYVGNNSIHLRRMAVVEQKALFERPGFIVSLRRVNEARQWGLNFDDQTNRLIPCKQTAKTILNVLLDHRLKSEITDNVYDVPDATPI